MIQTDFKSTVEFFDSLTEASLVLVAKRSEKDLSWFNDSLIYEAKFICSLITYLNPGSSPSKGYWYSISLRVYDSEKLIQESINKSFLSNNFVNILELIKEIGEYQNCSLLASYFHQNLHPSSERYYNSPRA